MDMTRDEFAARLAELIQELSGVEASRVREDARLVDDLDLDSIAVAEIATAIQERFGVPVADSVIETFKTVGDVIDYVAPRLP